jgi:cytidylate kinase
LGAVKAGFHYLGAAMDFVIAVDGPAASGKGTVASRLAADLGLPYLDTGLLYRAVGLGVTASGADPDDPAAAEAVARALSLEAIDEIAARTAAAGEAASRVAAHPQVRAALIALQRDFAARPGGAVLDGRDIGTVIAPGAAAKLFVTATPEVRAERRWKQLRGQGETLALEAVLADIRRRDARDSGRATAPLVQAADAVLLDTTHLGIPQAADAARRIVEAARARWDHSSAGGEKSL